MLKRPSWGMASHHRELAQLLAHLELPCARLDTKEDVNRAKAAVAVNVPGEARRGKTPTRPRWPRQGW